MTSSSFVVWHNSLTQDNTNDLERTQKTFCKLVLKEKYKDYENALNLLNIESLQKRREVLTLKFAKNGIKLNNLKDLLPEQENLRNIETRHQDKYKVNFANTDRLKNSSIISMQNLLNHDDAKDRKRKRNCG